MNNGDDVEPRMSFGDHLEELRRRVLWAVIGIFVFFIVGVCFQADILTVIRQPHQKAMAQINAGIGYDHPLRYVGPEGAVRAMQDFLVIDRLRNPAPPPLPTDATERERIEKIWAAQERLRTSKSPGGGYLVATRYPEAFLTGIKAAFILALLLGAPWTLYQGWLFVGAGLHPHERGYVRMFLPTSLSLFVTGAVFGYYVLIPYGLAFLGSMGGDVPTMITLSEYFGLFLTLTFALGVVFQLPLVMMSLTLIGIVPPNVFAEKRRFFILAAFVFGALLTPPDPMTQVMMAVPILVLYEVGLWSCKLIEARGKVRPGEESPQDEAPQ